MPEVDNSIATDDTGRSDYLSRKDIKIIGGALFVLFLLFVPIWIHLKKQGEATVCRGNMGAISKALLVYSETFDARFPPAYYPDYDGNPVIIDGEPISWVTLVQEGMSERFHFDCPTSKPGENGKALPAIGKDKITYSYGLYAPMALRTPANLAQPAETVLIGETACSGSNGAYNPLPFKLKDGTTIQHDGFLIGLDNSNLMGPDVINSGAANEAKMVTRLAFRNAQGQPYVEGTPGRHDDYVHVVLADGRLSRIKAPAALIRRQGIQAIGLWSMR